MKKGMVAPIFRYIFAAVAGAIILVFFLRFGMNMIKTESALESAMILNNLDDTLASLSTGIETNKLYPYRPFSDEVTITVGTDVNCGKISTSTQSKDTTNIIFSPAILKGKQLQLWTRPWHYPFPVADLFYMSNKKTRYYLVGGLGAELTKDASEDRIPKIFDVEYVTDVSMIATAVAVQRYDKVKVVSFDRDVSIPGIAVMRINVAECNTENCRGTIQHQGRTSYFVGKAMLYGAIFADDMDAYECQKTRALARLNRLAELYKDKAQRLYNLMPDCGEYTGAISNLEALAVASTMAELEMYKNNIIQLNNEMSGDADCVELF